MAVENPIRTESFSAYADYSTKQFRAMKFSGDREITIASAVTDSPAGVLQSKPNAAGRAAEVCALGPCKAIAGDTITAGANLTVDANGALVPAAPAAGVNNALWGYAMQGAVVNDIFEMFVQRGIMQGA